MLFQIGWIFFVIEIVLALLSGYIFWHFWSQSQMGEKAAFTAISVYAIGCVLCLLLSLLLPL